MQVKRSLLLIVLCISFLVQVSAQNNARMIPFYDKWPMMQDRQGYIWYVENSGRIGKYLDGDRMSDADLFDEFGGCDYVNFIKEDIQGHVWITTGCRFYRYDPVKKKFEDILQQILDQTKYTQAHTESWYEDTSGTVWFGGSALISYSLKSKKVTVHEKDSAGERNMRYNLFGGTGHTIWYSHYSKGGGFTFNQYDPGKQKIIRSFNFDMSKKDLESYMSVEVKTEKIIGVRAESYLFYIGSRLFEFDAKAGTLNAIPVPAAYGKAIEIGNNGLYNYVGTDTGFLLQYKPEHKNFEVVWHHSNNKPIEIIFSASTKQGAYAYADNHLIPITSSPPLFQRVIDLKGNTIFKGRNYGLKVMLGKIYRQEENRLVSIDERRGIDTITFQPKKEYPEDMIYHIGSIPGSNQFWQLVSYWRRMVRPVLLLRDRSGNLLQTYQSPVLDSMLKRSSVTSILTDRNKKVWINTYDGKICQFDIAKNEFRLIVAEVVTMMFPLKYMVDSKSNLWISNSTGGLVRYESAKDSFHTFHFDPSDSNSIGSNLATTAFEAPDGKIWIGTKNKGISILDPPTRRFRHLNKLHGLPELIVTDIAADKNGVIWVATREYISRWLPEQNRFMVYRKQDGISLEADIGKKVFLQEEDGTMLVVTNSEIMSFNPDSIVSYVNLTPPIVFTGFSIGDKAVVVGSADSILSKAVNFMDEISLAYAQNKFTIRYAGVDFYGNLEYAYRLYGFEDDWQYVKSKTEAMYTNVPPGKYEFQVKVANHQGYWGEVRSLPIQVKSPWYRTWLAYGLYALAILLLLRTYFRFRSRNLIQANLKLEAKVSKRTNELSDSLKELKDTQNQMVQREKMASLGELTAGIAHEIQNPLNFVNNFAEVNVELTDEMVQSIKRGDFEDAKGLAVDIRSNQEKIREHGKRADGIVKSMLLHSRTSTGQKEFKDLNLLADEYLRLSFHGMRAKDKSFNSDFELISDPNLPRVYIIPQDIGRVFLNIINNAFYAVNEKRKVSGEDFKPKVTVTLSKDPESGSHGPEAVLISISDNGIGIPLNVKEKIFQPFFTTKPTGEGTGLGLSMSYDIITKGHGGEVNVLTFPEQGTTFQIKLPIG